MSYTALSQYAVFAEGNFGATGSNGTITLYGDWSSRSTFYMGITNKKEYELIFL
jgi:hypothetical protein